MKIQYRVILLIITFFLIIFICPILLNSVKYYPNKLIFNLFYFSIIIFCYTCLLIWCYYIIKFIRDG